MDIMTIKNICSAFGHLESFNVLVGRLSTNQSSCLTLEDKHNCLFAYFWHNQYICTSFEPSWGQVYPLYCYRVIHTKPSQSQYCSLLCYQSQYLQCFSANTIAHNICITGLKTFKANQTLKV